MTSWDIIKHYNESVIKFSDLGYDPYQYWMDKSIRLLLLVTIIKMDTLIFLIAPQCHVKSKIEEYQPIWIKIYLNDRKGNFYESDIEIENNIGTLSGTRTTIVGDYNGDSISDVFVSQMAMMALLNLKNFWRISINPVK